MSKKRTNNTISPHALSLLMPFPPALSPHTISAGGFNSVGRDEMSDHHPNQAPVIWTTTDNRRPIPHYNYRVVGGVDQPIPGFQKLPKIIENCGPSVDVTCDETLQPPKADDQPPKTDEQPPATAMLPQAGQTKEWVRCVHPEGWIYFFKQHDHDSEGIECHEIRGSLKGEIAANATLNPSAFTDAANHEEVLEVKGLGSTDAIVFGGLYVWTYVDHCRWYASEDKALLFRQPHTDEEGNKLRLNYWKFLYDYPAHHPLPPGALTTARQALNCHVMEGLVRKTDTRAPFTFTESKMLLEHLDMIESDDQTDVEQLPATTRLPSQSSMRTILVAWVLLNVAKHLQTSKYGHNTFEDARKAESFGDPSVMFLLVSSICLFAPLDHRVHICAAKRSSELRGDIETWPAYIDSLVKEWSTFNFAATVLLSASMAFIAVPGLDSVTQIIVLSSVVFTLGSIMTGVYLLWRHQGGGRRLEYSISLLRSGLHVNLLAFILSAPFTFLVWGVLTFLVAVLSYSFFGFHSTIQGSNVPIHRRAFILVFVLSIVVLMTMLISFVFFRSFRKRRGRAMHV